MILFTLITLLEVLEASLAGVKNEGTEKSNIVFPAVFFPTTKSLKRPKYPKTGKWTNKIW